MSAWLLPGLMQCHLYSVRLTHGVCASPWGIMLGCHDGFSIRKIFCHISSAFSTPNKLLVALPYPLGRCCLSRIC